LFNFADTVFVPFKDIDAVADHGTAQLLLIGIRGHIQHFQDDRPESLGCHDAGRSAE
jgi:hypothetical protein